MDDAHTNTSMDDKHPKLFGLSVCVLEKNPKKQQQQKKKNI